jgi:hypothetical protein
MNVHTSLDMRLAEALLGRCMSQRAPANLEHAGCMQRGQCVVMHSWCSLPTVSNASATLYVLHGTQNRSTSVPTIDGMAQLSVPPFTQNGDVLRMRGKGVLDPRGRGRGDQLVHVRWAERPCKLHAWCCWNASHARMQESSCLHAWY